MVPVNPSFGTEWLSVRYIMNATMVEVFIERLNLETGEKEYHKIAEYSWEMWRQVKGYHRGQIIKLSR
jgi:hypothetical protein